MGVCTPRGGVLRAVGVAARGGSRRRADGRWPETEGALEARVEEGQVARREAGRRVVAAEQHRLQVDVRIEEQKVGEERDRVEVGGRERVARVGGDARLVGLLQLYPHRLVEVDLWVQCQSARKGICNTWKKKAVCMASSWVSMRENRCARQVGGRLGHEPVRNAGQVDRRPRQRGASGEPRIFRYRSFAATTCVDVRRADRSTLSK